MRKSYLIIIIIKFCLKYEVLFLYKYIFLALYVFSSFNGISG